MLLDTQKSYNDLLLSCISSTHNHSEQLRFGLTAKLLQLLANATSAFAEQHFVCLVCQCCLLLFIYYVRAAQHVTINVHIKAHKNTLNITVKYYTEMQLQTFIYRISYVTDIFSTYNAGIYLMFLHK